MVIKQTNKYRGGIPWLFFFFSHADLFYLAILQLCTQCYGRWIKARLESVSLAVNNFVLLEHCVTRQKWLHDRLGWKWTFLLQTFLLFMCKSCYSHGNKPMNIIIYMWKTGRFVAKHGHLQSIHRPWHSAGNCNMACSCSVFFPASETTPTMKGSHKDKAVCVNITFEVNNRYSASGVYML